MLRILEILIEGVIIYFGYKFVVHFVIPIYRTTKRVNKQMKDIQNKMNEQVRNQQQNFSGPTPYAQKGQATNTASAKSSPDEDGEYIDYEEVK